MLPISTTRRPQSLQEGEFYHRRARRNPIGKHNSNNYTQVVTLVGYAPCPAIVYVRDQSGKVLRCPRDEIYSIPASLSEYSPPIHVNLRLGKPFWTPEMA